jgi:hypothetical protein
MRNFFTVLDFENQVVKLAESNGDRYVEEKTGLSTVIVLTISFGLVVVVFMVILTVTWNIN